MVAVVVALGGEQVLHQPVAQGAQCMGLTGAGQSEGQDVHPPVDEVAAGQFPQLLLQA